MICCLQRGCLQFWIVFHTLQYLVHKGRELRISLQCVTQFTHQRGFHEHAKSLAPPVGICGIHALQTPQQRCQHAGVARALLRRATGRAGLLPLTLRLPQPRLFQSLGPDQRGNA